MERQSLISVVKAGWAFSRNGLSWRTVPFRASALESRSPVGFLSASPLLLFVQVARDGNGSPLSGKTHGEGHFSQLSCLCRKPLKRGLLVCSRYSWAKKRISRLSSFVAHTRAVTRSTGVRSGAPGPPRDLASLWGDLGPFKRAAS